MKWNKPPKNPNPDIIDLRYDSPTIYLVMMKEPDGHLRPAFGKYYKSKDHPELEPHWYIDGYLGRDVFIPEFWTPIKYPTP